MSLTVRCLGKGADYKLKTDRKNAYHIIKTAKVNLFMYWIDSTFDIIKNENTDSWANIIQNQPFSLCNFDRHFFNICTESGTTLFNLSKNVSHCPK